MLKKLVLLILAFQISSDALAAKKKGSRKKKAEDACSEAIQDALDNEPFFTEPEKLSFGPKGVGKETYRNAEQMAPGVTVWGKYKCNHCGKTTTAEPGVATPNQKDVVACTHCGEQHTDEPYFLDTDTHGNAKWNEKEDVIEGNLQKAQAASGKKISCAVCGSSSFTHNDICSDCGTPLEASIKSAKQIDPTGQTFTHTYKGEEAPEFDPRSLMNNEEKAAQVGTDIRTAAKKAVQDVKKGIREHGPGVAKGGAIVAGTLGVGGTAIWMFQTHPVDAKVTDMKWVHSIEQQRYTRTETRQWRDETSIRYPVMPTNGHGESAGMYDPHNCGSEFHHNRHYKCGEEHYTETVWDTVEDGTETYTDYVSERVADGSEMVNNGNGSFTSRTTYRTESHPVTRTRTKYKRVSHEEDRIRDKYCDEPIYQIKCDYYTYEWRHYNTRQTTGGFPSAGQTGDFPWPDMNPGPYDRLSSSSDYKVTFRWTDKKESGNFTYTASGLDDFLKYKAGTPEVLDRARMGSIMGIRRKN